MLRPQELGTFVGLFLVFKGILDSCVNFWQDAAYLRQTQCRGCQLAGRSVSRKQPATAMSAGFLLSVSTTITRSRGCRWLALRARALQDEPRCVLCLANGRLSAATAVDHIVPLQAGGSDAPSNLQPLCHDCHATKSAAERGARRKPVIGVDGWPVPIKG